jgi:3'-5' exoribonuclease
VWERVHLAEEQLCEGAPVLVLGSYREHPRYGPQIAIEAIEKAGEVDWERLLPAPVVPLAELDADLDLLLASVTEPYLGEGLLRLLGAGSPTGREFRRAPAAQYNHHAYRGGLLAHSLQVAGLVDETSRILPGVDRDLAVCGALLHDIGKLESYSPDGHCARLNDTGRLIGEIPAGFQRVKAVFEGVPGFPQPLVEGVLHIILSHHGCLEWGSPVVPATREAILVHTMDKLSGDFGSIDRLARETASGEAWSRYDRALGRAVKLGDDR